MSVKLIITFLIDKGNIYYIDRTSGCEGKIWENDGEI